MGFGVRAVVALAALAVASAECPNACSGHGTCTFFDECDCNQGYMANDCSERICPFGFAHVDGAKGDLDGDEQVTTATPVVVGSQMYPVGAVEGVDATVDDSAHAYMECSNKGICDRTTGTCKCFPAYEGYACQRASCPAVDGKVCGGHGVCRTVRELANGDYSNDYELWDADKGMACDCDPGYSGFDCSERECPIGVDPLYRDDTEIEPRYPIWTFRFDSATVDFTDFTPLPVIADTYRIKFYDASGEDWITAPIGFTVDTDAPTSAGLSADSLEAALLALENGAVPEASCSGTFANLYIELTCAFPSNFGPHRVPEIITTDSNGDTTLSAASDFTATTVFDKGVIGETTDYFAQLCKGVSLTLTDVVDGTSTLTLTDVASGTFVFHSALATAGADTPVTYSAVPATMMAAITSAVQTAGGATAIGVTVTQLSTDVYSIIPPGNTGNLQLSVLTPSFVGTAAATMSSSTAGAVAFSIVSATLTGGTFKLTSTAYGFTTGNIAYDGSSASATAGNIETALELLTVNTVPVSVTVTGSPRALPDGQDFVVTFVAPYGGDDDLVVLPASRLTLTPFDTPAPSAVTFSSPDVKELTITGAQATFVVDVFDGATHALAAAVTTAAGTAAADLDAALSGALTTLGITNDLVVAEIVSGTFLVMFNDPDGSTITLSNAPGVSVSVATNVASVAFDASASSGSWTISANGAAPITIAYGANAGAVTTAVTTAWTAAGIVSFGVAATATGYDITFNDSGAAGTSADGPTQALSVVVTDVSLVTNYADVTVVDASANGAVVDVSGAAADNLFTLTTNAGGTMIYTTAPLSDTITPTLLKAALEGQPLVSGITTVLAGVRAADPTKYIIAFVDPVGVALEAGITPVVPGTAFPAPTYTPSILTIDFSSVVTGGTFDWTYGAATAFPITAMAALPATVEGEIAGGLGTAGPTGGAVTVTVTFPTPTRYVITFSGGNGGLALGGMSIDYAALTPLPAVAIAVDTRANYVMQTGLVSDTTSANDAAAALKRFKTCLADADGDPANNIENSLWDYGFANAGDFVTYEHPHLVKLVKTLEPGAPAAHALAYWHASTSRFDVMTKVGNTGSAALAARNFYVGATDGTLAMVYDDAEAFTAPSTIDTSGKVKATVTFSQFADQLALTHDFTCDADAADDAAVAAAIAAAGSSAQPGGHDDDNCIRKGDLVVVPFTQLVNSNPGAAATFTNSAELRRIVHIAPGGLTVTLDRPLHYTDENTRVPAHGMPLYKFTPAADGSSVYDYATQCAGRGLCDRAEGLCTCFRGYTGPDCSIQSALSM